MLNFKLALVHKSSYGTKITAFRVDINVSLTGGLWAFFWQYFHEIRYMHDVHFLCCCYGLLILRYMYTYMYHKIRNTIIHNIITYGKSLCLTRNQYSYVHSCNFMITALLFYEVNAPLLQVCYKP